MKRKDRLISLILEKGIVKTNFKEPIRFKSGILSPIYCNFRECSSYPEIMKLIREEFEELLRFEEVDCIIGVATGAISHATILAESMKLPSGYIRPDAKPKDYGLKNLIEGCSVSGKNVVIIEDLISTGGSVINNATIAQKQGALNVNLASIFSYDMKESTDELFVSGFELKSLIHVKDLLPHLKHSLDEENYEMLVDWVQDPRGWFSRHKLELDFGFLTSLRQQQSIISFGLDPVLEALPSPYFGIDGFSDFMEKVFITMKHNEVYPGMFKPNLAWWESFDEPRLMKFTGSIALSRLMSIIRTLFPDIPIVLDNKTGDIGTSSGKWAKYGFEGWGADALTVHSYMGSDSIGPYAEYCNKEKKKGAYLLVKTTNKGSADLQTQKMFDGRMVFEHVADKVIEWAKGHPGIGVVAAGNSPEELLVIAKKFQGKDIPLLIPGIGSQGGELEQVLEVLEKANFELALTRINLSSGLTHPWYHVGLPNYNENDCIALIVEKLRSLNQQVSKFCSAFSI